jgi:putative membrane protein
VSVAPDLLVSFLAHGAPLRPEASVWTHWNRDPVAWVNLALLAGLYARGWSRRRAARGEPTPEQLRQACAFWGGWVCLGVALVSPIDVLAAELLWVHMVQHMVLMNLAAPLIVLGAPVRTLLWALSAPERQIPGRTRRWLDRRARIPRYLFWQPVSLWLLYAVVMWVWHLPRLYEAALRHDLVHDLQHLMFFAVSCLFWRVLFDPIGRLRMAQGAAVLYLFLTSLHATVLGVFMALAPRLWYPTYAGRTEPWGLTALGDQQLAGYIMWMPACMMYALVAAVIFARWLAQEPPTETARPAPESAGL